MTENEAREYVDQFFADTLRQHQLWFFIKPMASGGFELWGRAEWGSGFPGRTGGETYKNYTELAVALPNKLQEILERREQNLAMEQEILAKSAALRSAPPEPNDAPMTLAQTTHINSIEDIVKALKETVSEVEIRSRVLRDGIYTVSDNTVVEEVNRADLTPEQQKAKLLEFLTKYPDGKLGCCFASAYNTDTVLVLSERPQKWEGKRIGGGFNYGSTNFIKSNQNLLILAEND